MLSRQRLYPSVYPWKGFRGSTIRIQCQSLGGFVAIFEKAQQHDYIVFYHGCTDMISRQRLYQSVHPWKGFRGSTIRIQCQSLGGFVAIFEKAQQHYYIVFYHGCTDMLSRQRLYPSVYPWKGFRGSIIREFMASLKRLNNNNILEHFYSEILRKFERHL